MKSKAKILTSFLLVVLILVSVLFTGMISVSAYSVPPNQNRLPEYTPSTSVKTYNINFALPKKWTNEIWEYYGSNCGLYWWGSKDNPDEAPAAAGHGWPGWKLKKDNNIENLYSSLVPEGTASMIFDNFIDCGMDDSYLEYYTSHQTKDLTCLEYFGRGDSDYFPKEFWDYIYDTYYEDMADDPSFKIEEFGKYADNFFYSEDDDKIYHLLNDMVFVVDTVNTDRARVSPVSGKAGLDGAFYFYYGNGEFGIWPTKEMCIEKEGLKVDNQGNVLIDEETVQEETDFVLRNHTDAYDGTTKRDFVVFGNFTGKYWEAPSNGTIGDCIWTLKNNTLTISGNGEMGYHSKGDSPWGYKIEKVIIEDGVTSIATDAFWGCSKLTSVTITDSVTSIGDNAFFNCSSLESITIPDSVTSIGDNVFSNCSNDLEIICVRGSRAESYAYSYNIKVKVPDFLYDKLDDGTLKISKYLGNQTNVIIPDNILGKQVSSIKAWIFANDTDIESVVIPDTVATIPKGAFYNCVELKTVSIGNNVTEIGANAFEKCLYLENINLSDNLQTIGDEAFYDCRRLKTLGIPVTVTSIGEEAFTNCRSLQSLTIPKGVNKLGDESSLGYGMFENCQNLTEVKIPKTVSYIQSNAFDGCKNLTIAGAPDSYAKSFAENNNIPFRAVVDDAPIGDSNGDGNVDVLDAAAIQKFASGMADMTNDQQYFADVNNDGVVDILDAAEIQKFAAGIITEFKKKG